MVKKILNIVCGVIVHNVVWLFGWVQYWELKSSSLYVMHEILYCWTEYNCLTVCQFIFITSDHSQNRVSHAFESKS